MPNKIIQQKKKKKILMQHISYLIQIATGTLCTHKTHIHGMSDYLLSDEHDLRKKFNFKQISNLKMTYLVAAQKYFI